MSQYDMDNSYGTRTYRIKQNPPCRKQRFGAKIIITQRSRFGFVRVVGPGKNLLI